MERQLKYSCFPSAYLGKTQFFFIDFNQSNIFKQIEYRNTYFLSIKKDIRFAKYVKQ